MSLSQTPNAHVSARGVIPDATVSRLPMYHRSLLSLTARGVLLVSSEELAEASGVSSAKLRKDLSFLGSYGTRGVGYDVATDEPTHIGRAIDVLYVQKNTLKTKNKQGG